MSELVVTAIVTPKPGQSADKLEQLLASHAAWVQENEPDTLRYRLHKTVGEGSPVFVMLETYKSQAAFDAHGKSPRFQEIAPQIASLADLKFFPLQAVAGFEARAKI